jgi:uncharacterized protein (TIGR02677 family)
VASRPGKPEDHARDRLSVALVGRAEPSGNRSSLIATDEQLIEALERLVLWGNLHADVDTSRVTTVEDFHRKRCLYQLTAAGQAAEQAITFYEEAIGRRGQLQSVALADIADRLRSLRVLAADDDPDPAKVHLLLLSVAERFSSLADNAQAFMSALRRAIDACAAGLAWMCSWHGAQTTSVLRRIFAMSIAHAS